MKHVIIDNASGTIKVGMSGQDLPQLMFPTKVEEASTHVLKNPNDKGFISDWNIMEMHWERAFKEVGANPRENNVLFAVNQLFSKDNKEKLMQIMFEKFNVKGLYILPQTLLSLYATSNLTGFVVDSGEGITQFAGIKEGHLIPLSVDYLPLGGEDITNYFLKATHKPRTMADYINAQSIKESVCYVSNNIEIEMKNFKPVQCTLPDGQSFTFNQEPFRAGEGLFEPLFIEGRADIGIPQKCHQKIQDAPIDLKKDLISNIILSGGTTLVKGFVERFAEEVKNLQNEGFKRRLKITATPNRQFNAWTGGSVVCSNSGFGKTWITKKDYDTKGGAAIAKQLDWENLANIY